MNTNCGSTMGGMTDMALLVLLLVAAAYCMVRATETASTRWIAMAGCAIGCAFLTKMLQAFLVVPGFALVFLVAAPVGMWKRIGKLAVGAVAMIVTVAPYVALVSAWPADSRPYIGGSSDNSLPQLALGYNGIERAVGVSITSEVATFPASVRVCSRHAAFGQHFAHARDGSGVDIVGPTWFYIGLCR